MKGKAVVSRNNLAAGLPQSLCAFTPNAPDLVRCQHCNGYKVLLLLCINTMMIAQGMYGADI